MSFRLLKLVLHKHRVLGSLSLIFCNDEIRQVDNEIYNTVIIGENGIGKSYILKAVTDIFNFIHSKLLKEEESHKLSYRFELSYSINGIKHMLSSIPKGMEPVGRAVGYDVRYYLDGIESPLIKCKLPQRIIASSMTISDKFRAVSSEFYKYNGIRNERSQSTTGTRTLVRKTVSSIILSISYKNQFRDELRNLLSKLGLQTKMTISYGMRHKEVFLKNDISPKLLLDIFENRDKYFPSRSSDLWGTTFFSKIKDQTDKLEIITDFLRKIATKKLKRRRYIVEYDILNDDEIINDAKAIDLLSKLDILTFPSIRVYKNYENYNFMDSSSGETNLLCQFIGILSVIQEDSLIIIDEPENSSHPNWQINYIAWLKDIFSQYHSCHFVLATHSHFILSDLQEEDATIIALEKVNGKVNNIAEKLNTYCWSVDDILYRVFGVCNTRNHAFESDIMSLYKMMSEGSNDLSRIKQLTSRLSTFVLPENDPLSEIINQAKKYVEVKETI